MSVENSFFRNCLNSRRDLIASFSCRRLRLSGGTFKRRLLFRPLKNNKVPSDSQVILQVSPVSDDRTIPVVLKHPPQREPSSFRLHGLLQGSWQSASRIHLIFLKRRHQLVRLPIPLSLPTHLTSGPASLNITADDCNSLTILCVFGQS